MTRIIMHGCNGRMGQFITRLAEKEADMEIVAGVDVSNHIQNEYPVFSSIADCDVEADVVIDFASAKAVDALLAYCVAKKLPCVLCTTGLSEEQLKKVKEPSGETAVLKSANMSMGINLLLKLLREAAQLCHERLELKRMLDVKTSQARMSARLVAGMPAAMIVFLTLLSTDFRAGLATTVGALSIVVALALNVGAWMVIRKIMRVEV